jgi:integrase/recombinase XerD
MEELKLHQFEEKLRLFGYAERTIGDNLVEMKRFFSYLQEKENITALDQLQTEQVKAYQAYLTFEKFPGAGDRQAAYHLSRNTVRQRLFALRIFFRIMYHEKLLPYDYTPCLVLPKKRRSLPKNVPTQEEMRRIIQAAVPDNPLGIRDRFLLELLYATGIRSTEVRSLTVHDLNIQERTLFIGQAKGGKQRLVPLGDWVLPYALEHLHTARPFLVRLTKAKLLFPSRNGWPLDPSGLHKIVNFYRKKAGLDMKLGPHTFRHACATHLIQQGADIRFVQELLGHEDLGSTQVYTKVTIGDLKKAHAKYHPANKESF